MPDFLGAGIVHPWEGRSIAFRAIEVGLVGRGFRARVSAGAETVDTLCAQSFSDSNTKKLSEIPFFARRGRRANAARKDG
jgi:hypothetical protein